MPLGRPRAPGTDAERAEARRAKVRQNVQNFRRRQREKETLAGQPKSTSNAIAPSSRSFDLVWEPSVTDDFKVNVNKTKADENPTDQPLNIDLPVKIAVSGPYQDAFISALQYSYLAGQSSSPPSDSEPNMRVSICCSTWVSSACLKVGAPGTEMLSDALLASALNIISREKNDPEMALDGVKVHARALNRLRTAFDKFTAGEEGVDPSVLSLAALTCAMSELLANKSWDNFAKHLQGVGALIEHSGPSALSTPSSRDHFYGYRAIQAAFCFSRRQETFMSKWEWIEFPWKDEHPLSSHPIHTMLDIAFQIPAEANDYDISEQRSPHDLRSRLQKLRKIALRLDQWKLGMDLNYPEAMYNMRPARWDGLHEESIEFGNLAVASAFTFYTGVRIKLFHLIREVAEELALFEYSAQTASQTAIQEALKWSRLSCQCYDFFNVGDNKIVGKLICLFPFDAAWETFTRLHRDGIEDLSTELAWCQQAADNFTSMGLPVLNWR